MSLVTVSTKRNRIYPRKFDHDEAIRRHAAGLLIDVNGPDHLVQKTYGGPGGGYTRDYDKVWELGQQRWHKRGWDHWIVLNSDCRRDVVEATAATIVEHLVYMADHRW